jgi:hypothetical protein
MGHESTLEAGSRRMIRAYELVKDGDLRRMPGQDVLGYGAVGYSRTFIRPHLSRVVQRWAALKSRKAEKLCVLVMKWEKEGRA